MKDFRKLIGKKILHKITGNIFIVLNLETHSGVNDVFIIKPYNLKNVNNMDSYTYIFDCDFDEHFEVLKDKINNWRSEIE